MVNQTIIRVLKFLSGIFHEAGISWVVAGSVSLSLQGVNVEPGDIDILTDKQGACRINRILEQYKVKEVEYSQTENFSSFYGVFKIFGIKVEVMGDYKEKAGDKWISLSQRLRNPRMIRIEDIECPVSSIKSQLSSYKRSTRKKDADKTNRILHSSNI